MNSFAMINSLRHFLLSVAILFGFVLNIYSSNAATCPEAPTAARLEQSSKPILIECPGESRNEPWGRMYIYTFVSGKTPEQTAASYFHYENMARIIPGIKRGFPRVLENPCPTLHLLQTDISNTGSDESQRMWNLFQLQNDGTYSLRFRLARRSTHFFNIVGNIDFWEDHSTRTQTSGTYVRQLLIFNPDIGIGEGIAHRKTKESTVETMKRFRNIMNTETESNVTSWVTNLRTAFAASNNGRACTLPER